MDSFDDDEIIEYAKKHLDMILIEEATTADEAIDSLGRIKKYWGEVGPWDSIVSDKN